MSIQPNKPVPSIERLYWRQVAREMPEEDVDILLWGPSTVDAQHGAWMGDETGWTDMLGGPLGEPVTRWCPWPAGPAEGAFWEAQRHGGAAGYEEATAIAAHQTGIELEQLRRVVPEGRWEDGVYHLGPRQP